MILDKSRLKVRRGGMTTQYTYDYPSKEGKVILIDFGAVEIGATLQYYVQKSVTDSDGNELVKYDDTRYKTFDLKEAWEKFEDYFEETQKEENPEQNQEEPEVQILCMSVNKDGQSFVFLQKQDGNQELIFELKIDNYDIINTKPKFAKLDFTGNSSIQVPFNTEWALGLVDDITFADAQIDSTTYAVALKSVDQPGQNQQGEPQDDKDGQPDDKGDKGDKGEPGDDKSDKGQPGDDKGDKGQPGDDKGDKGEPGDDKSDKGQPGDDKSDKGQPGDDKSDKGQPGDDKKDDGRTPPEGPDEGKGKPTDEHGDDEEKKPGEKSNAKVTGIEFSSAVKEISDQTGLSPDNIEAALRTERTFDTFLTLQKVNVNELKDKLNASSLTRNQFIKQVVSDFKKI